MLVMMRALSSMAPDSGKGDSDLAVQQAAAAVAVVQRQSGRQQCTVRGERSRLSGVAVLQVAQSQERQQEETLLAEVGPCSA